MTVMIAPTAMIARAAIEGREVGGRAGEDQAEADRMTSRISRGMTPTAAIPVPAVKPRPSDLARV